MKLKAYNIVADAIERGVGFGYRRSMKHTNEPQEDDVIEAITNEVLGALSEIINWDDEPNKADEFFFSDCL